MSSLNLRSGTDSVYESDVVVFEPNNLSHS
jgi:hypothetical protein